MTDRAADNKTIKVDLAIYPEDADEIFAKYLEIFPEKISAKSVRYTARVVFTNNRSVCFTFSSGRGRSSFKLIAKAFAIIASRATNKKIPE